MKACTKVRVDVYGWTVYFFHARELALQWMKRHRVPQETVAFWCDEDNGGVTSLWSDERSIYIGIFTDKPGTVAHECVHAANFILDNCGVTIKPDNDEPLTYLVGHLVNGYYKAAKRRAKE